MDERGKDMDRGFDPKDMDRDIDRGKTRSLDIDRGKASNLDIDLGKALGLDIDITDLDLDEYHLDFVTYHHQEPTTYIAFEEVTPLDRLYFGRNARCLPTFTSLKRLTDLAESTKAWTHSLFHIWETKKQKKQYVRHLYKQVTNAGGRFLLLEKGQTSLRVLNPTMAVDRARDFFKNQYRGTSKNQK